MNDIQLRTECVRLAVQTGIPAAGVVDLAKRMFDWISQGCFGPSDLPSDDQQKLKAA